MVWSKIDPVDKEKRYIRRVGDTYFLTRDSRGAEKRVPDGWMIWTRPDGRLGLRQKR